MKKHYILYPIVLIIGLLIGALVFYFTAYKNMLLVMDTHQEQYHFYVEEQTNKAYNNKNPKIAIWSLLNFLDYLKTRNETIWFTEENKFTITNLTYVRLALMYKKIENEEEYKKYMNIALKMINDKFNDKTYTEKDLIKSVKVFYNQ